MKTVKTKNFTGVRKVKLEIIPQAGKTLNEVKKELLGLQRNVSEACNTVVNELFFNELRKNRLETNEYIFNHILNNKNLTKEEKSYYENVKKLLVKEKEEIYNVGMKGRVVTDQSIGYSTLSSKYGNLIPSRILTSINAKVTSKFKNDLNDVLTGKKTISNYRKDCPIPFNFKKDEKSFPLKEGENGEIIFKPISNFEFRLVFGKDRSNNRSIVSKILSGEYKLCDSSIIVVFNNIRGNSVKEIMLDLCFSIPVVENKKDSGIVMGVDLGINSPISWAIDGTNSKGMVGTREEFFSNKIRFSKQRKSLQESLTIGAVSGKGRKKKISALNRLKNKEHNYTQTTNHRYSKELIKIAKKFNVSTIKLEDLTNINTGKDKFLKIWPYYQLQQFIEYKAKREGITVLYINPKNTSLTCTECGEIGQRERSDFDFISKMSLAEYEKVNSFKIGQFNVFVCTNIFCKCHGNKVNADMNAACNISKSQNYTKKNKNNLEEVLEMS